MAHGASRLGCWLNHGRFTGRHRRAVAGMDSQASAWWPSPFVAWAMDGSGMADGPSPPTAAGGRAR
jgi:hypothetical protein